ncbi:MAG: helix-turn-helix domain-containing protein [Coriobacteriales bacterium]|nr:helix-turn-helix domain-containing protein [Coriobacteriales bacterium]
MAKQRLEDLPACPVETTLSLIGNKWQTLILRDLSMHGTLRFKELQRSIGGISQKVLTSNLRAMEDSGIVRREVFAEVPPRVEYSLTETGRTLQPVLDAMSAWGESYKARLRAEEEAKA